jgi:hypothetical protein
VAILLGSRNVCPIEVANIGVSSSTPDNDEDNITGMPLYLLGRFFFHRRQ